MYQLITDNVESQRLEVLAIGSMSYLMPLMLEQLEIAENAGFDVRQIHETYYKLDNYVLMIEAPEDNYNPDYDS